MNHLLKRLDDPSFNFLPREFVEKTISENWPEKDVFVEYCPLCGHVSFYIQPSLMSIEKMLQEHRKMLDINEFPFPTYPSCIWCYEMDLYEKVSRNIDRAKLFIDISDEINSISSIKDIGRAQMALLDQAIILILSGLESYLKDVYSILWVHQHNFEKSTYDVKKGLKTRFQDSRNWLDFKTNLGLSFIDNIDTILIAIIQLYIELRHVIVHNAGRVDNRCLDNIAIIVKSYPLLNSINIANQKIGKKVALNKNDVIILSDLVSAVIEIIDIEYEGKLSVYREIAVKKML